MAKAAKPTAKRMLANESYNFLRTYINTPSPTGFEYGGQKVWMNYLKPYVDEIMTDPYGTAVGIINPNEKFKVVIEAHADEISWFVNYISENGLIYLKRNGGVDHQIAPGKRVFIHGKKSGGLFPRAAIQTCFQGRSRAASTARGAAASSPLWPRSAAPAPA